MGGNKCVCVCVIPSQPLSRLYGLVGRCEDADEDEGERWDGDGQGKGGDEVRTGAQREGSDLLRPSCSPITLSVPVYSCDECELACSPDLEESKAGGTLTRLQSSLFPGFRLGLA